MQYLIRRRTLPAVAAVLGMLASLLALTAGPAAAQTFSIAPVGGQVLDAGRPACIQMVQTGGDGDITWSAAGLPAPLTINRNGLIEGTPVAAGQRTVTVTATDDDGDTAQQAFTMSVVAPSGPIVKAGRLETGFTIDCTSQEGGAATNQFLSDVANFGPSGTYRLGGPLVIASHTAFTPPQGGARIDARYLSDADVLMDGWVRDGQYSQTERRLIRSWVQDGGVLIAAEDWFGADQLANLFGVTMAPDAWLGCHEDIPEEGPCPEFRVASGSQHPIVRGPFGSWSRLETNGTVGWFPRNPRGWNVIATGPGGGATVIEKQVGQGNVILLSDEGMLRSNLDGDNGRFLGNLMAYALDRAANRFPDLTNDVAVGRVFRDFRLDFCANDTAGDGQSRIELRGQLPYNLTRNGCVISGVPTERSFGNHQLTYTVRDADGDTATGYISITINGDNAAVNNPRCAGVLATIVGTPGDDRIIGTPGDDVIIAGNGRDFVDGKGGNDIICGGKGNDTLKGGKGADSLYGEGNKDRIGGGKGRPDLCNGGRGKDKAIKGCERRVSM